MPAPIAPPAPADPKRHQGPLRLAALAFKNVGGDAKLDYLKDAWPEALVTDLAGKADYQLIERGQLDVDLGELAFTQNANVVDPATRAQLGRIQGAEVVVLGSFQKEGDTVRASARFVNAETGEVLAAVRLDRPADKLLDLQDAVSAEMVKAAATARTRLRP
jgi:TolB-like protein